MRPITLFVLVFLSYSLLAQPELIFTNAQSIDPDRYKDIKGSPYLFKDWQMGFIIDDKEKSIKVAQLNYNGYSRFFEVKEGDKFIELDSKAYQRVEVDAEEGEDNIVFQRGIHPFFKGKFVMVLYANENLSLIKESYMGLYENTIQDVGKTREIKRFTPINNHFVLRGDQLEKIKIKKKEILKILNNEKNVEKILKEYKIKLNNEKDLVKLLKLLDQ